MKNKFSKLVLALILPLMAGCGNHTTSSPGASSKTEEMSNNSSSATVEHRDYVHDGSVKLELDYKGKDFYKDGIGQVELYSAIDGDTAHFTPLVTNTSTEIIKSRFFGIDTPESTGKIEEWGHAASEFTKAKLNEAKEKGTIVVSTPQSDYGSPKADSTGSRYVSLIWINTEKKNANYDELVLLNLWIVQEGLSYVKNVADMPNYSDAFYAAEEQAKQEKLHLFSNEEDPDYPRGDYQTTSLLDLKNEILAQMNDANHVNKFSGKKVRIQGTVAGYVDNILYLQDYFDEDISGVEGGVYAGINIFTGMTQIPSKFCELGAYIQVCGVAMDNEQFGFQITDTSFPRVSSREKDAVVIYKASENVNDDHKLYTFEKDPLSINASNFTENLFCNTKLTKTVTITEGYDSADKSSHTLSATCEGTALKFSIYMTFPYSEAEGNTDYYQEASRFVGKSFDVTGVWGFHKTKAGKYSYQLIPMNSSNMVLVS